MWSVSISTNYLPRIRQTRQVEYTMHVLVLERGVLKKLIYLTGCRIKSMRSVSKPEVFICQLKANSNRCGNFVWQSHFFFRQRRWRNAGFDGSENSMFDCDPWLTCTWNLNSIFDTDGYIKFKFQWQVSHGSQSSMAFLLLNKHFTSLSLIS